MPEHCALLAAALDEYDADFAYSQIFRHGIGDVIGVDPPYAGQIDANALMWRAGTMQRFGAYPTDTPHLADWRMVEAWMRNGARWVHVPTVTVDYYYHPGSTVWRG